MPVDKQVMQAQPTPQQGECPTETEKAMEIDKEVLLRMKTLTLGEVEDEVDVILVQDSVDSTRVPVDEPPATQPDPEIVQEEAIEPTLPETQLPPTVPMEAGIEAVPPLPETQPGPEVVEKTGEDVAANASTPVRVAEAVVVVQETVQEVQASAVAAPLVEKMPEPVVETPKAEVVMSPVPEQDPVATPTPTTPAIPPVPASLKQSCAQAKARSSEDVVFSPVTPEAARTWMALLRRKSTDDLSLASTPPVQVPAAAETSPQPEALVAQKGVQKQQAATFAWDMSEAEVHVAWW